MTEIIKLKEQHPQDDLDHAFNFAEWFNTGDTLSSCAVSTSQGITLGASSKAPTISGNEVVLWLTGGTPGEEYFVQVTAQTSQGRRKTVDGSITIIDPTSP